MANTINTRIVLRHDTHDGWEAVKDNLDKALLAGEMGIDDDTGLFKIGKKITVDGETRLATWAELEYANEIPEVDLSTVTNHVKVVDGTVDDLGVGQVVGDMGIVRAVINGNVKSHTAYVWNGTAWEAMDGNYDATNVYFKKDITLAGSYTQVGNVTKSSNAATGTLSAAGKSLADVMQSIFTQELYPATGSNRDVPNIALSGDEDKTGEVGSSYTLPTVTVKVSDVGSYAYGPATGIKFEAGDLTISQGSNNSKTNESDMVKDNTMSLQATDTETLYLDTAKSYTFNASGSYTNGVAPKTNLGNLLDNNDNVDTWTYRIPAGTATATARTIKRTGYRNMFAGGTTAETVDSAVVRGFSAKKGSKPTGESSALEFTAAGGTTKVVCAFPNGWTGTPYFEMFGLAWAENTNFVARTNVNVADARGNDADGNPQGAMSYKVYSWELSADAPLEAETTKFRVWFK